MSAFDDPGFGGFSSRFVVEEQEPVLFVYREDDGDWQFLAGYEEEPNSAFTHTWASPRLGHIRFAS